MRIPSSSKLRELPALAMLLIPTAYLLATNRNFRALDNLASIGQDAAFIGIMACGEALVILTGGIDLSVASVLALPACACAERMTAGWAWPLPAGLGLCV